MQLPRRGTKSLTESFCLSHFVRLSAPDNFAVYPEQVRDRRTRIVQEPK